MADTKKLLNDEELDQVNGGNTAECLHLDNLGLCNVDELTELAAKVFKVDKSAIKIELYGDCTKRHWDVSRQNENNLYKIGKKILNHNEFVSALQAYLNKS